MRLVIINGATRGLGFAISDLLVAEEAAEIICLVRNPNHLSELDRLRDKVTIVSCDYADINQTRATKEVFSAIDFKNYNEVLFINNACLLAETKVLAHYADEEIITNVNTNLIGNLIVAKNFLSTVKEVPTKVYLLNISSGIAQNPKAGMFLYGLSKSYLDQLSMMVNLESKAYQCELTATSYYPGGINTGMQDALRADTVNPELEMFDFSAIQNQNLDEPSDAAKLIYRHFIAHKTGWGNAIISKSKLN